MAVKTAGLYNRRVGRRNAYLRCSVPAPLGKRLSQPPILSFQFSDQPDQLPPLVL
jgi:hypothetical protein